jgi:precorrin-3B C17-methyltransferase
MKGSIVTVGIGPGSPEHLTPAAREAIEVADIILGYTTYLRLIDRLAPDVPRKASAMREEVSRVAEAIDLAQSGLRVALISGGDPGIYGMAGLVYEVLHERNGEPIDITVVPGVSALNAAAALLGAPLMTDFAAISLSDQMVSRDDILRRVELATLADFVLCLYNPLGRHRTEPFARTCEIIARHRRPQTPVGLVRAAYRNEQQVHIIDVAALPQAEVDMMTVVVIGNSRTFTHDGKMVTPRGYGDKYDLGEETTEKEL